jgi:L-threonylcarbamoyladenylate synthase
LIVNSLSMAKKLAYIDERKERILKAVWPGAVSVILKKRDIIPVSVSADTDTVSLRMPDSRFCLDLIKAFNSPITSTSANISGEDPFSDPNDIFERFKKEAFKPDLIIDGGVLEEKEPSTIVDLTGQNPKIVRVGMVKAEELSRILEM